MGQARYPWRIGQRGTAEAVGAAVRMTGVAGGVVGGYLRERGNLVGAPTAAR